MARVSYVVFFVISCLLLLSFAEEGKRFHPRCPSFSCGRLRTIAFPFSTGSHPECGLLRVDNCNEDIQKIQLGKDGPWFNISGISQDNTLILHNQVQLIHHQMKPDNHSCEYFNNLTLHSFPFLSFEMPIDQAIFKCPGNHSIPRNFSLSCNDSKYSIFYHNSLDNRLPSSPPGCSHVPFLQSKTEKGVHFLNLYTGWFSLKVQVPEECYDCHYKGGQCRSDSKGKFQCSNAKAGITNYIKVPGLVHGYIYMSCFPAFTNCYFAQSFATRPQNKFLLVSSLGYR